MFFGPGEERANVNYAFLSGRAAAVSGWAGVGAPRIETEAKKKGCKNSCVRFMKKVSNLPDCEVGGGVVKNTPCPSFRTTKFSDKKHTRRLIIVRAVIIVSESPGDSLREKKKYVI